MALNTVKCNHLTPLKGLSQSAHLPYWITALWPTLNYIGIWLVIVLSWLEIQDISATQLDRERSEW